MFGKHILVLVPHPDDEVVASAAALGRADAEGATLFALYLTHGCIAQKTLWPWQRKNYQRYVDRRSLEAKAAAKLLNLRSLGIASRPARHLWRDLENVYNEIDKALTLNEIDQIWVPAYEGGNADHDALNALGQLFIKRVSVLEFAEYNFFKAKANAQSFPYPNGTEQTLFLTNIEQAKKKAALALYSSEKQNLTYVGTERECFRPLASYNYTHPPHPGTLWYARFQWVPFRHPRVDFTQPGEVSKSISGFLPTIKN